MGIESWLVGILTVYVAWNLGANDIANSMGTSVGSKALSLRQALAIAAVLEFLGAVLLGSRVASTLATDVVDPMRFAHDPGVYALGMVSALVACGLWVQVATWLALPVSTSHAIVGAIAGFAWLAVDRTAIQWSTIGLISFVWIITPVFSGAFAAAFYSVIRRWVLHRPQPIVALYEWIPWLSVGLISVFGGLVLPAVIQQGANFAEWLSHPLVPWSVGAIATVGLSFAAFRHIQTPEAVFAKFQIVSACFVAFAHGSNDIGNAIAPLAVLQLIRTTQHIPTDAIAIPIGVLLLGAVGMVAGLAVLGKRVIQTVGEGIASLQPSQGFCAELATATTVLLASLAGLPVSTSHALVGAVVGTSLLPRSSTTTAIDAESPPLNRRKTLIKIGLAWFATVPISALLSALVFAGLHRILPR
ncbi:inorganic phosphate transporter [Leptolyngbya sp. AN02str]|uniref:inorganic phosphate transporter n=1 Tax=Leptolyngbya sp. AN02str TaxID=3423363 RepID=UPI003D3209F9